MGFLFVIAACTLWALDTLIRYPLVFSGIDAYVIVLYEHLFLAAILVALFMKSFQFDWKQKKGHLFYFFFIGAIGSALSTLAFTKAFVHLNPSLVIILQKFQPIVATMLAAFFLKEKIGKEFIFWGGLSLVAGLLISFQDVQNLELGSTGVVELFKNSGTIWGYFLVIFSVIGWGASTVFGKKLTKLGYNEETIMSGRIIFGLLTLIPFVPFTDGLQGHGVEFYGKVLIMTVVSGVLALYLYYQGLKRISAHACSLAEMFFPLMAVIVNWIFLGTTLSVYQIVGGVLLVISSVVIQIKHY